MENRRYRSLVRSAFLASFGLPIVVLCACDLGSSSPVPDAADDAAGDAAGDAAVTRPADGGVPADARVDVAPSCVEHFDAAPVTCSEKELLQPERTCPTRPGVCGSDGRTYCSAASAASAGASVVVSTACELPCGSTSDGGPRTCNAATEYCYGITNVAYLELSCRPFYGCASTPTCACQGAGLPKVFCSDRDGGIHIREQGFPTARQPGGGS